MGDRLENDRAYAQQVLSAESLLIVRVGRRRQDAMAPPKAGEAIGFSYLSVRSRHRPLADALF
jgi:hypothetical protein